MRFTRDYTFQTIAQKRYWDALLGFLAKPVVWRTLHDSHFAHDANDFFSITVTDTPSIKFTILQRCLITLACHFVHREHVFAGRKVGIRWIEGVWLHFG